MLLEVLYESRYRRCFLSDGDIDTIDGLALLVAGALVDDGIYGDGGLSGLSVTDDELTLSSSDRNHGVHRI